MKKPILALAAVLGLFATGEATAGGYAGQAVAAANVIPPWSGFYLGLGGDAGAVVHDLSTTPPGGGFDGIGGQGIFGTAIVGYDQQIFPGVIVGVFADHDLSGISSNLPVVGGLINASLDHKHSWSVGSRAGFLSSPSALWYGTAGYTQAQFDLSSTAGSLSVPNFKGYFVGAGVESQFGRGWALRAEYRFSQFNRETVTAVPGLTDMGLEPSMHTARLTLTYKFGRREEAPMPMK
jgi:outer membrane immunogenic protein